MQDLSLKQKLKLMKLLRDHGDDLKKVTAMDALDKKKPKEEIRKEDFSDQFNDDAVKVKLPKWKWKPGKGLIDWIWKKIKGKK